MVRSHAGEPIFAMYYKLLKENKSFLLSGFAGEDNPGPGKNKFWALDSKKKLEENLKNLPEDWYYRNHDVTYTVNSMGYRAPEFGNIDWKNSVVVFGCSTVFGDGVDDNDTMPAQLSKILNKPVINMGAGGSGIDWALHNSLILKEFYPNPLAVVHLWTDPSRITIYGHTPIRMGVWHKDYDQGLKTWIGTPGNIETYAYFTRLAAKHIWNKTSIYYDFSWSPQMVEITGCDNIPDESRTLDQPVGMAARDLCHQGKVPLGIIAEYVAKKLKTLGLNF